MIAWASVSGPRVLGEVSAEYALAGLRSATRAASAPQIVGAARGRSITLGDLVSRGVSTTSAASARPGVASCRYRSDGQLRAVPDTVASAIERIVGQVLGACECGGVR